MTAQELETKISDLLEEATNAGVDIDDIISALELALIEIKGEQGQEADEEGFATEDP
jgi:hypothetical protein